MRRRSKWTLAGIGIVVVALIAAYATALARSNAKLREVYAALEKDGRPMRAADMIPVKVPDEQNAAPLYLNAVSVLKAKLVRDRNMLNHLATLSESLFKETDDPDKQAKYRQDVAELKELIGQDLVDKALSMVEQGTQRPACQFQHDYEHGTSFSVPAMKDLRELMRVIGAKAYLEAEAGQSQKAWARAVTLLRFADAARNEPGADNQLFHTGMINYSCWMIREMCGASLPDETTSNEIERLLVGMDDVTPLMHAIDAQRLLEGERVFNLPDDELFEVLRKDAWTGQEKAPGLASRLVFRFTTFRPRFVADHAAYLQIMRMHIQLLQGPYISRESPQYKEIERLIGFNVVTNRLAPALWGMQWFHCRTAATIRLTRAGLALLRYKQTHGTFPASLDALGLKDLTDPFIDQPLHYRVEGDGFVVYSVYEDLKDNGGIDEPLERRGDRDMPWHFKGSKGK